MLNWWNSRRRWGCVLGCLALAALLVPSAGAEEIVVKNDTVPDDGGTAVIVGDFIAGEEAAAWLTSPCDGTIVAVQIFWLEGTPGHGQSLEQAIHIYNGGSFPSPGSELALLEGPVMTPGYLNEFRYLDEAQTMPLSVPVTAGQNFVVSFEFYNPTDVGNGGPSVVRDINGCQSGRNALYAIPGGWLNFCLFLGGDLGIRAVIDCPGVTGACCRGDGSCENEVEEADCLGTFDDWYEGQSCAEITCPDPIGACCNGTGGCINYQTQATCETVLSGIYAGHATLCADDVCDLGACCLPNGDCEDVVAAACLDDGGAFEGPGTTCATTDCPQPTGACCIGTNCFANQTEEDCTSFSGDWLGAGTDCGPPNPCAVVCHIVSSDPQHGWIDARAPLDDQGAPAGWSAVDITFNAECDASTLDTADFALTEVCNPGNCDEVAPAAAAFSGTGNAGTLTLERPIDPKAWTVISLVGGDQDDVICLGYLPADSDASRTSNANDIVKVVDYVNDATGGGSPPWHSTNIDRSQLITANDIIELVDLLNGAGDYEVYYGVTLPPLP